MERTIVFTSGSRIGAFSVTFSIMLPNEFMNIVKNHPDQITEHVRKHTKGTIDEIHMNCIDVSFTYEDYSKYGTTIAHDLKNEVLICIKHIESFKDL